MQRFVNEIEKNLLWSLFSSINGACYGKKRGSSCLSLTWYGFAVIFPLLMNARKPKIKTRIKPMYVFSLGIKRILTKPTSWIFLITNYQILKNSSCLLVFSTQPHQTRRSTCWFWSTLCSFASPQTFFWWATSCIKSKVKRFTLRLLRKSYWFGRFPHDERIF